MASQLRYIVVDSPVGDFILILDEGDVVVASGFGSIEVVSKAILSSTERLTLIAQRDHSYKELLCSYFSGQRVNLNLLPSRQLGSRFQESAWSAVASIPYGETRTYKEIAALTGRRGAVRAVGTACGANQLILLVPCHRVTRSDGSIGSYIYGESVKRFLLELEFIGY